MPSWTTSSAATPCARVAVEVATTTGLVFVLGEMTTEAYCDVQSVVRDTVREIGYDHSDLGFDWETCGAIVAIKEQSPDIAMGVDNALESREGTRTAGARRRRPGNDVRLRQRRDAGADACLDRDGPPRRAAARGGPQVRRAALPAPRRQEPGDDRLRRDRASGPGGHRAGQHAARSGGGARRSWRRRSARSWWRRRFPPSSWTRSTPATW